MKVIDLFAGCGGLTLGFQRAGFDVVAAYEDWLPAIEIYRANFNHPIFEIDLSSVDDIEIFNKFAPEMIMGGPPCQDFSSAGKRDETLGRADLTISFAHIISVVKPQWFVMENVDRIVKSDVFKQAVKIYKKSGYGLSSKVLNASYCGVPQARKRLFMIGHLESPDGFLDCYLEKNQSVKPMTVRDYFGDYLGVEYYYRHPRSYKRRGVFSIHEPSPTIRGVNRPIPKGYVRHLGDPCEINSQLRPLTTIERSYIQTFPKDFKFFGSKTDLEQIIGNAVPVNLAKYVGYCINDYIKDRAKSLEIYKQTFLEYAEVSTW